MTETIINLETVNPIEFFGVNNGKLDLLKKKFPLLKILSRGTQIKLSGAPEQIESAKEKIDLIIQYLERNGHLSENYFEQILGGDDAETVDNFVDRNPNDILVFGPNGKTVRARTQNQKKMVQAADKNDIVFAIGPAGTGKTYTAVALAVRALKNKLVKKIILTRPAVEAGARADHRLAAAQPQDLRDETGYERGVRFHHDLRGQCAERVAVDRREAARDHDDRVGPGAQRVLDRLAPLAIGLTGDGALDRVAVRAEVDHGDRVTDLGGRRLGHGALGHSRTRSDRATGHERGHRGDDPVAFHGFLSAGDPDGPRRAHGP